jgi:hypothetical protein
VSVNNRCAPLTAHPHKNTPHRKRNTPNTTHPLHVLFPLKMLAPFRTLLTSSAPFARSTLSAVRHLRSSDALSDLASARCPQMPFSQACSSAAALATVPLSRSPWTTSKLSFAPTTLTSTALSCALSPHALHPRGASRCAGRHYSLSAAEFDPTKYLGVCVPVPRVCPLSPFFVALRSLRSLKRLGVSF